MSLDIAHTIIAKSDQLNADDLVGGQVTVTITDVKVADSTEQPVIVHVSGGHKPWKPCKTMRRLLSAAWSTDASTWIGHSLTLYREPSVKWAGEETGGIRVLAMSHINQGLVIRLTEKKGGKKLEYRIAMLAPDTTSQSHRDGPPDIAAWKVALTERTSLDAEKVCEWLGSAGMDITKFSRADLRTVITSLTSGGGRRTEFDAWMSR